jgi:hypothetical protein
VQSVLCLGERIPTASDSGQPRMASVARDDQTASCLPKAGYPQLPASAALHGPPRPSKALQNRPCSLCNDMGIDQRHTKSPRSCPTRCAAIVWHQLSDVRKHSALTSRNIVCERGLGWGRAPASPLLASTPYVLSVIMRCEVSDCLTGHNGGGERDGLGRLDGLEWVGRVAPPRSAPDTETSTKTGGCGHLPRAQNSWLQSGQIKEKIGSPSSTRQRPTSHCSDFVVRVLFSAGRSDKLVTQDALYVGTYSVVCLERTMLSMPQFLGCKKRPRGGRVERQCARPVCTGHTDRLEMERPIWADHA